MSTNDERFERLVSGMLEGAAPKRPPTDLVANADRAIDGTRRWPRWWAALREPTMRLGAGVAVGSPVLRRGAAFGAAAVLVLGTVGAGVAGAKVLGGPATIVVDQTGGGDVATIAEALERVGDGDEIHIRPGTYVESVVVEEDVSITGGGPADTIVITAPDDGPTVRIGQTSQQDPYAVLLTDSNATLSNLTFAGEGSQIHIDGGAPVLTELHFDAVGRPWATDRGIEAIPNAITIADSSDAVVLENTLRESGPISIYGAAEPRIEGNTLSGGASIAVYSAGDGVVVKRNTVNGALSAAITILGRGSITVEENQISDAGRTGIHVGHHSTAGIAPEITGNTIRRSETGIYVDSSATPRIIGNALESNGVGLVTGSDSADLYVARNVLIDNQVGIDVGRSAGRYEGNTILGGVEGIEIIRGGSPTLTDNTVEGASWTGISISDNSSPVLVGNRLCGNAVDVEASPEVVDAVQAANETCDDRDPLVVDATGMGDATSITEAVAMADDGDTVVLRPGVYEEAVVISKDITLRGARGGEPSVIAALSDGPTRAIGETEHHPYAVLLQDSSATLSDLSFSGLSASILVDGGAPTLERLLIERVGESRLGTFDFNAQSNAIAITGQSRAVVRDTRLVDGGSIAIYDASEPMVVGNELLGGPSILAVGPGDGAVVRGNVVSESVDSAITVFGPNRMTIEGNTISDAAGSGVRVGGIRLESGNDPTIRSNTIERAKPGILVASAAAPLLERNIVLESTTGINVADGRSVLRAMDNILEDNDIGLSAVGRDVRLERNTVRGGGTGVLISGGESVLHGNTIEGASRRGLTITGADAPNLEGNRICGSRRNLVLDEGIQSAEIRAGNDICEDAAFE